MKLRLLVERTNQQQPDLMVLLGDFMSQDTWHGHRVAPEIIANHLKYLQAPLGVYAVLGNHDWWDNGDGVRRSLEQAGIRVLENDVSEVKRGVTSFWPAGLADLSTRSQQVPETLAKIPSGSLIIALTHHPDVFPHLPRTVPLLLAAHTHGGQVNFPLIGTPNRTFPLRPKVFRGSCFRKWSSPVRDQRNRHEHSAGRFRVPPEIAVLTIESQ